MFREHPGRREGKEEGGGEEGDLTVFRQKVCPDKTLLHNTVVSPRLILPVYVCLDCSLLSLIYLFLPIHTLRIAWTNRDGFTLRVRTGEWGEMYLYINIQSCKSE